MACLDDNFYLQAIEETTESALMDFLLTENKRLVENMKIKSNHDCSDHGIMEFRILRIERRMKSKVKSLDFRRTVFCLLKVCLGETHGISPWREEETKKAD